MPEQVLILLVEDEPIIRELIQALLEDADFAVVTADHGGDAVQLLDRSEHRVQLLMTDVGLGEGPDGWAIARYARRVRPELPIIYFSGSSDRGWLSEGVPKSLFLQKPLTSHQLVKAVQTMLRGGCQLD